MTIKNLLSRGNFLGECYNENTGNRADLVSLNEVNARSLIDRHTADGYVIVSPCRGGADFGLDPNDPRQKEMLADINHKRVKEFVGILKQTDFSYTPVYGGFIENKGKENEENVYERSFVVYNHHKDESVGDFGELYQFALDMARKYNQDSVLIQEPNDKPKYITKDNEIVYEFDGDFTFNDIQQRYFIDLHKGCSSTRFSFLESYINPKPQCYGERFRRDMNGEIFLGK